MINELDGGDEKALGKIKLSEKKILFSAFRNLN
jgi:hypothetical protein